MYQMDLLGSCHRSLVHSQPPAGRFLVRFAELLKKLQGRWDGNFIPIFILTFYSGCLDAAYLRTCNTC